MPQGGSPSTTMLPWPLQVVGRTSGPINGV
jgi:hypothetical protein